MQQYIHYMSDILSRANTPYESRNRQELPGVYYPQDFERYYVPETLKGQLWPQALCLHEASPWKNTWNDYKIGLDYFALKDNKELEMGLQTFFMGPTVADCGMVLQAAIASYIRSRGDQQQFEQLVTETMGELMITPFLYNGTTARCSRIASNPWISMFTIEGAVNLGFDDSLSESMIQLGDILHVGGVEGYEKKHLAGVGGGWNLICVEVDGEQKLYLGFGPGKFPHPLTMTEIEILLLNSYNENQNLFVTNMIEQVLATSPITDGQRYNYRLAQTAKNLQAMNATASQLKGIRRVIRPKAKYFN